MALSISICCSWEERARAEGFLEAVVTRDTEWRPPKNQKHLVTVSEKVDLQHLSALSKYLSIFWRCSGLLSFL